MNIRKPLTHFNSIPRLYLQEPLFSYEACSVYGLIAITADPQGRCDLNVKKIAKRLNMDRDVVETALEELEKRGWIRDRMVQLGSREATVYTLEMPPDSEFMFSVEEVDVVARTILCLDAFYD
jgi:hypothetical protein